MHTCLSVSRKAEIWFGGSCSRYLMLLGAGISCAAPHPKATLIEGAWWPEQGDVALEILRGWLAHGFEGEQCPFLVKQHLP